MNGTIGKICTNKDCPEKGIKQPYDNFYKGRGFADGYQAECKSCVKGRSRTNNKKRKDRDKQFYSSFM